MTVIKFHLHWLNRGVKTVGNLQKHIEEFLERDDNSGSVVTPHVRKAKKGIRYCINNS